MDKRQIHHIQRTLHLVFHSHSLRTQQLIHHSLSILQLIHLSHSRPTTRLRHLLQDTASQLRMAVYTRRQLLQLLATHHMARMSTTSMSTALWVLPQLPTGLEAPSQTKRFATPSSERSASVVKLCFRLRLATSMVVLHAAIAMITLHQAQCTYGQANCFLCTLIVYTSYVAYILYCMR